MTYQLICEGLCNPTIRSVDADVARFRSDEKKDQRTGPMQPPDDSLVARLRLLTYTAHEKLSDDGRYACLDCGSIRRYGF